MSAREDAAALPPAGGDVAGLSKRADDLIVAFAAEVEDDVVSNRDEPDPATVVARLYLDDYILGLERSNAALTTHIATLNRETERLRAVADAAREWTTERDPQDQGERALFVALFDTFPGDFPGRENCGCDQSEMECDECMSIHQIRADIERWRAETTPRSLATTDSTVTGEAERGACAVKGEAP